MVAADYTLRLHVRKFLRYLRLGSTVQDCKFLKLHTAVLLDVIKYLLSHWDHSFLI